MTLRVVRIALAFVLTRIALVMSVALLDPDARAFVIADVNLYVVWLTRGIDATPLISSTWQYPPGFWVGIAPVDALPDDVAQTVLVALLLATDAAICAFLVRAATRRGANWAGAWFWVVGGLAVGPVLLFRLDLVPSAAAVLALLAATPTASGAWSGIGTALKAWPVVTLLQLPRRGTPWRSTLVAAAIGCVGLTALGVLLNPATLDGVAGNQAARGLQVESIAALPWHVAGLLGHEQHIVFDYGAFVIGGSTGTQVGRALLVLTLVVMALIIWPWWIGRSGWAGGPDVVLVATVALVLTSRVFSPQFIIWIAAVAAVVAAGSGPLRRLVWWLLPIFAATALYTVIGYEQVVESRGWPTALLIGRNLAFVVWGVVACVLVTRATPVTKMRSSETLVSAAPQVPTAGAPAPPPDGPRSTGE